MSHYDYTKNIAAIWEKAVKLYEKGQRGSDTYFEAPELEFLAGIGVTAQEVYDFAEDYAGGGDPDFGTFVAIHDVRRAYFLEVQKGVPTGKVLPSKDLPARDSEAEGIRWLPRLIAKAYAKLHGELSLDIMYDCGGDRNFFRTHNIHPAEFLRVVWQNEGNDDAIVTWVKARSGK
jgi:hypothetical protein